MRVPNKEDEKDANLGSRENGVKNADETTEANSEDDGKVSNSSAIVNPYPVNADEKQKKM